MVEEFNQIVRLLDTDVKGNFQTVHALTKVHGISNMFSNAICSSLNVDKTKKIGELSSEEIKRIESAVQNPDNIPNWLYNRQKDLETGKDSHLLRSDLKFQKDMDIKNLRKIKCYRGVRHSLGLPVRGQKTRSNFRKGKTVGVRKKGITQAKTDKK
ncbi:MAG: 30S ribosomal protein S13 [Nanoarchaeota archaeon]|jgi:small subunit ribosomal protein S13|nr:30S ribosomal protein S13 [Nanoarchaeota archaeon]|tara:strand:- start:40532 stop:40999 length:468 start_codon:yes stop_codon:yes gene_type:complete